MGWYSWGPHFTKQSGIGAAVRSPRRLGSTDDMLVRVITALATGREEHWVWNSDDEGALVEVN